MRAQTGDQDNRSLGWLDGRTRSLPLRTHMPSDFSGYNIRPRRIIRSFLYVNTQ
jgi:hypothetical protein